MSKTFAATAAPLAAALAFGLLSAPAAAVPVLQTNGALGAVGFDLAGAVAASHDAGVFVDGSGNNTHYSEYLANGGLLFSNNISGTEIHQVADVTERMLGRRVDALAKLQGSGFGNLANYSGDDITLNSGALSLTCTSTDGKCTSFDWSFDQTLSTIAADIDWNVIAIGVKYGSVSAFFLVDAAGTGADSGSFDLFAFGPQPGLYATQQETDSAFLFSETAKYGKKYTSGPNLGACKTGVGSDCLVGFEYKVGGLSHVDFLGTVAPPPSLTQNVPEPEALALLVFGLAGIGIARRRQTRA